MDSTQAAALTGIHTLARTAPPEARKFCAALLEQVDAWAGAVTAAHSAALACLQQKLDVATRDAYRERCGCSCAMQSRCCGRARLCFAQTRCLLRRRAYAFSSVAVRAALRAQSTRLAEERVQSASSCEKSTSKQSSVLQTQLDYILANIHRDRRDLLSVLSAQTSEIARMRQLIERRPTEATLIATARLYNAVEGERRYWRSIAMELSTECTSLRVSRDTAEATAISLQAYKQLYADILSKYTNSAVTECISSEHSAGSTKKLRPTGIPKKDLEDLKSTVKILKSIIQNLNTWAMNASALFSQICEALSNSQTRNHKQALLIERYRSVKDAYIALKQQKPES